MIQHLDDLKEVLNKYDIDPRNMIISSSSALAARGICENNDVDLILPRDERKRIIREYNLKPLGTGTFDLSRCVQVCVEKYDKYGISDNDLLECKDLLEISGYRVTPLELEMCRIIDEDREKDLIRVRMIEKYIEEGNMFDFELFKSYMDYLNRPRNFGKRIFSWLKYNNPKRSGCASFLLALYQKIKLHITLNYRYLPNKAFSPRLTNVISPGDLLLAQNRNGEFSRFDILVNYHSIKEFCESEDKSFCLSRKKDIMRTGFWQAERYTELIDSIKNYGYSLQYPILIDSYGHLIDGGHRLAAALYFGVDMVSVRIVSNRKEILFGEEWFVKNGFTVDEIRTVKDTAEKDCALKNGVCTVALAFAYSEKYWEEILRDIGECGEIIKSGILELEDELKPFLEDVYSVDAMEKWKVEFKYNLLKGYNKSVMYIMFKTPVGQVSEREDGISLNREVTKLKARLRNKYASKLGDYCKYSDTIIHMGDNSHSNKLLIQTIAKYSLQQRKKE